MKTKTEKIANSTRFIPTVADRAFSKQDGAITLVGPDFIGSNLGANLEKPHS